MLALKGELHNFLASDKLILTGFLYNQNKRDRAILYLHGMGSTMLGGPLQAMCSAAISSKAALFTFNNRGAGTLTRFKRINGKKTESVNTGTACERFEDCIYDIEGAIRFLKSKGYSQIILVGHSTGCQKAAYYQSLKKDKRVKAIILLAPCDDMGVAKREWGKQYNWLISFCKKRTKQGKGDIPLVDDARTESFSPKRILSAMSIQGREANIFNYDKPIKIINKLKLPILAILGKKEQYAVIPPSKMLSMIAKEFRNTLSSAVLIPGNHNFIGGEKELENAIVNWLKKIK